MKFSQISKLLKTETKIVEDFEVSGVSSDSRTVGSGDIFVAIEGLDKDGSSFIKEAISRGAGAIIYKEAKSIDENICVETLPVACPRKTLSLISSLVYKIPSTLSIIAVTGTNGKTTTTYLLEHIFKNGGLEAGTIGTINCRYKEKVFLTPNTTPEPVSLCKILKEMAESKLKFALLEVSSHALKQARVDNINFKHAIFTNLSSEHLDFHGTMEAYFAAKSRLFIDLKPAAYSIINIDDKFGQRLKKIAKSRVLTYGFSKEADIKAENVSLDAEGIYFDLCMANKKTSIRSRLLGRHNIYNILSACAAASLEGVDFNSLKESIFSFKGVPGRLQRVDCGQLYFVYVDYAHTPAALESVLKSLREFVRNRIITVFGCGGNRDRRNRPLMGEIAGRLSDVVILTNDNPRDEDPLSIICEIKSGAGIEANLEIEKNRRKAIRKALNLAQEGDCVLIAGKGHENYQIIKNKRIEFNDTEVIKDLLKAAHVNVK